MISRITSIKRHATTPEIPMSIKQSFIIGEMISYCGNDNVWKTCHCTKIDSGQVNYALVSMEISWRIHRAVRYWFSRNEIQIRSTKQNGKNMLQKFFDVKSIVYKSSGIIMSCNCSPLYMKTSPYTFLFHRFSQQIFSMNYK